VTLKQKLRASEVDVACLKEIQGWRKSLARHIALRNADLSSADLNAAVQLTIARLLFLRMAEDRGLEPGEQLLQLCERPGIYARFMRHVCRRAGRRYKSSLFHFGNEPSVLQTPDRITLTLSIDDEVFKPIIQGLYFAHGSPLEFRVLPVEILGTVYERFLGKVIRLAPDRQVKIEENPEVRKAGGVYYTPAPMVDYIVQQTVGRKTQRRSPAQLAGADGEPPLRVLDMACGSGLFLLDAYQRLLDHCLKWYIEHDPNSWRREVYRASRHGPWRLTIAERKRILTTHIFGVDIDPRAVEVTRLSLLLKALEGEHDAAPSPQRKLVHDRALPNLPDNIKSGNSLVGPDCFAGKPLPEADIIRRINPFDWNTAFPEAMKAGGFDCILGNPPYVRVQTMKKWAPLEAEVYQERFRAGRAGNFDIYAVFIEQGLKLLNPKGLLGFICPHKFFNAQYGAPLRDLLSQGRHLAHIVYFGAQQVFPGATTYTCLLFLAKAGRRKCRFVSVPDLAAWMSSGAGVRGDLAAEKIDGGVWNFTVGQGAELVQRLKDTPVKLGDVADIFVGLQTSADDVFILDAVPPPREGKPRRLGLRPVRDGSETQPTEFVVPASAGRAGPGDGSETHPTFEPRTSRILRLRSKSLDAEVTLEKDLLFPLVSGTDVQGYAPLPERQFVLFPYQVSDAGVRLLPLEEIEARFPQTAEYLRQNQTRLEDRERGRMKRGPWHGYVYLKNMKRQGQIKICVPRLVDRLCAGWDGQGTHFLDNVDVGGVTLKPAHASCDLRYLLALLNSRLLAWFFPHVSAPFRGNWMSANRQFLSQLPIRKIDFSDPLDRSRHDRLLDLVDQVLALHRQAAGMNTAHPSASLSRQIAATGVQIDDLVYGLYGLSEDEVRIVDGAATEVTK